MGIFERLKEFRLFGKGREERISLEDLLLQAGVSNGEISKQQALNIPTLSACVELISNTIATLPVAFYKDTGSSVEPIDSDNRINLLNDDTGDTLDGFQFKKAIVEEYLLNGNGYAFINRDRNSIKSLHYVDCGNVSININSDPIFKDYDILVYGNMYRDYEFLKITRKTKDGVTGLGIIEENQEILSVVYNSIVFENVLVKTGGNKKGFLKAKSRLSEPAMEELKAAWKRMYRNNSENVMVLNEGLEFQESSNTSVEMQLNENKKTNAIEICKLFNVPPGLIDGRSNVTDEMYNNFIKLAILPILNAIEKALNKDLLLPSEKGSFFFAFDTKDLLKGDMEKRYKAYEVAVKNGILQIDEVRYKENLAPLGLDFIKLGLQDVLYDPKTKQIYTPNTNKTADMDNLKTLEGGEKLNEDRDKE